MTERRLTSGARDALMPVYAPDGRHIAYVADRSSVRVLDPADGRDIEVPPGDIPWKPVAGIPAEASQQATLFGATDEPGSCMVLVRWSPGFMSAPHLYATDRLCVVVSGTWFVASGVDFAPDATVAVPAGSFVRRVACTIHYDGVPKGASEPAVIAITGQGPVDFHLVDGSKPLWRAV